MFAVILGVAGVGIYEILYNTWELGYFIFSLGISQSAARYLASLSSADSTDIIQTMVQWIRFLALTFSLCAAIIFGCFPNHLSQLAFGDVTYAKFSLLMGIAIGFQVLCESEKGILIGLREVRRLAYGNALGVISGSIILILTLIIFKLSLLPWILCISSLFMWIAMFWQARSFGMRRSMDFKVFKSHVYHYTFRIIQLGLVLTLSGILTSLVAWVTKFWIRTEYADVDGQFNGVALLGQAFRISGLYVNFVLGAMAADFLPRLTQSSLEPASCRRTVNEQIEVGILMVVPGIVGLVLFREYALSIFYTKEFVAASPLVVWFSLGCLGRVITWPIAYLFVAFEKKWIFFGIEILSAGIHLGLIYLFMQWTGITGAAMAFAVLYLLYGSLVLALSFHQFQYLPSRNVVLTGAVAIALWLCSLLLSYQLASHLVLKWVTHSAFLLGVLLLALWRIASLLPQDSHLARKLRKLRLLSGHKSNHSLN
jgi:PST family polysaccharide transporter